MRIRGKLKPKIVNEILELKESRGDILNFTLNFVQNVSLRYNFIHSLLKDYKSSKGKDLKELQIASGLYLSSLVTCWETFFKDVTVFIVETDKQVNEKVKISLTEKSIQTDDLVRCGINIGDFTCKQFNFQNFNDTCDAFNFMFNDDRCKITDYLNKISFSEITFSSPNYILYWLSQKDDVAVRIEEILTETFNIRHKVIHDANFAFKIDSEFMTKVEDCFIVFPQLISLWLSDKYNQKRFIYNRIDNSLRLTEKPDDNEALFIFCRQDFDAEYEIVD